MSTITDFEIPTSPEKVNDLLEGEFVRPLENFQGKELWPYGKGSQLLFLMVESPGDIILFRSLAFVYLHIKRGGKSAKEDFAKHVIPLIWSGVDNFRAEVVEWYQGLSDDDVAQAMLIAAKELKIAGLSEIISTPPATGPVSQKKRGGKTRRAQPGKSSPRQKT